MKLIVGVINAIRSGCYSGKGFKAARQEQYEKALHYYELALKYSEHDIQPVLYDFKAIAQYKLNIFDEALASAKKSIEQYSSLDINDQKIHNRIKVLENFVKYIENL